MSDDKTLNLLNDLVAAAIKGGADAADAVTVEATSRGVSWREGKLEDVEGSEGEDIGLRVFFGKKQAMVSTSDRRPDSLKALVERTLDMARAVPEDACASGWHLCVKNGWPADLRERISAAACDSSSAGNGRSARHSRTSG